MASLSQNGSAHGRGFGPQGGIHTEQACKQAGGLWIPVVFGWMTHIYPNAKSPHKVWAGMDMQVEDMNGVSSAFPTSDESR